MMRPYRIVVCLSLVTTFSAVLSSAAANTPAKTPRHRVVAMYFHRTHRCPTCQKIGAYAEEAVKSGFVEELKQRRAAFHLIDFQDRKNAEFVDGYQIKGPTLILADVKDGKVVAWKRMPKVWSLVGKKDEFLKYVRGGVRKYLGKDK